MAEGAEASDQQTTTVGVLTSAPVLTVSREPGAPGTAGTTSGQFKIRCLDGRTLFVDDLVLASSGPGSLRLLAGLPGTNLQQAALRGIEFHDAVLALHLDPLYAAADPRLWSFLNCGIHGSFCEASMWLASVLPEARPETAATIWKSWITHRAQPPALVLRETAFKHMLPTPTTLFAEPAPRGPRQRRQFAGSYVPDSQEPRSCRPCGRARQRASASADARVI